LRWSLSAWRVSVSSLFAGVRPGSWVGGSHATCAWGRRGCAFFHVRCLRVCRRAAGGPLARRARGLPARDWTPGTSTQQVRHPPNAPRARALPTQAWPRTSTRRSRRQRCARRALGPKCQTHRHTAVAAPNQRALARCPNDSGLVTGHRTKRRSSGTAGGEPPARGHRRFHGSARYIHPYLSGRERQDLPGKFPVGHTTTGQTTHHPTPQKIGKAANTTMSSFGGALGVRHSLAWGWIVRDRRGLVGESGAFWACGAWAGCWEWR